jgi:hypothetical protein
MRDLFVQFCSEITGFPDASLEGTGLVETYRKLIEQVLGDELVTQFYDLVELIVRLEGVEARQKQIVASVLPSTIFWPVTSNLISLWYLGVWTQLPATWYQAQGLPLPGTDDAGKTHVPSDSAYVEQLSYRVAGAHPPGAKPTGFGSWSIPPVF